MGVERECLFYFSKKLLLLAVVIFINLRKRNLDLLAQIQSKAPTAKKPPEPYPCLQT